MASESEILDKLEGIKSDLSYIKKHMVDSDMFLDEEDRKHLEEARKEIREGKTTSLEDLKKKFGL